MTPQCPYCGRAAQLATGADIYPTRKDLAALRFWRCKPCKAHVGCHRVGVYALDPLGNRVVSDGTIPFGSLARGSLRQARTQAHAQFDMIWKSGKLERGAAYALLAAYIEIPVDACHIGSFSEEQCQEVLAAVAEFWRKDAAKFNGKSA